ncbi:pyridoxamine 5'-phosphate oxidase family protein [Paenibacillus sp. SYP-B4298]|uniref:pyridoxamine 5'-phosphate oxidase family protein n=1 Tax=Paenibacillus sp. SYP-B4298 TaxID=2996034 RepID=UPI0022DCE9CA|nr:pyridoxamine 5'-phosphate oxidase family protein [Paenibacillus sp. SYP-B4298]
MRRKEFDMSEQAEQIEAFLQEMSFGVLGTNGSDGWPELTPLNFVFANGVIYFHGSIAGRKMKNLKADEHVTFSVAKEYAIIPSYFSGAELACPATAFFKSVVIKGIARPVSDLEEKAEALGAFMRKLQPEGGYAPLDASDPDYIGNLKSTSVVRIDIQELTAKYKFGQNMKTEKWDKVADSLCRRNEGMDNETVAMMRSLCPHAGQSDEADDV